LDPIVSEGSSPHFKHKLVFISVSGSQRDYIEKSNQIPEFTLEFILDIIVHAMGFNKL
jgi:hypothetical protein